MTLRFGTIKNQTNQKPQFYQSALLWARPRRKIEDFSFHLIFNDKTYSYTLEDLKNKFEPVEIPVAIQCAGNRRSEYNQQVTEKKVNVSSVRIFQYFFRRMALGMTLEFIFRV